MLFTCKTMLDKRIKPNMQWAGLIYTSLLTYNKKLAHSTTGLTPNRARQLAHAQDAYIRMKKSKAQQQTSNDKL